jgi:outer membrane lipoprotein SlyB
MKTTMTSNRLHPLIAMAAIAVTSVSVLGAVLLVTNEVTARHAAAPEATIAAMSAPAPADTTPAAPAVQERNTRPAADSSATKPAAARPRPSRPRTPAAAPAPAPAAVSAPPEMPAPAPYATATAPSPVCHDCGTVAAVREIRAPGEGSGVGAVAGGVVGGVVGNQIGRGSGRDVARILGAIGGAVAGHQIEKQARATTRYEISVQMEDGSVRTLTQTVAPGVRTGDRVRVDGGVIRAVDGSAPTGLPAAADG